jgi:methylated-DNA-protein-cysteine methyltransferase-like protein
MGRADTYQRIYRVVRRIPRGRVATYGQVARLAGLAGHARQVGYALHALPDGSDGGEISRRAEPGWEGLQRSLLEAEGISFGDRHRVALSRFAWRKH